MEARPSPHHADVRARDVGLFTVAHDLRMLFELERRLRELRSAVERGTGHDLLPESIPANALEGGDDALEVAVCKARGFRAVGNGYPTRIRGVPRVWPCLAVAETDVAPPFKLVCEITAPLQNIAAVGHPKKDGAGVGQFGQGIPLAQSFPADSLHRLLIQGLERFEAHFQYDTTQSPRQSLCSFLEGSDAIMHNSGLSINQQRVTVNQLTRLTIQFIIS